MKHSLSDLLVQIMYFRALSLDPKNMSDREADWVTRTYQTLQVEEESKVDEDLSTLDDEALMEKLYGNLNHDQKNNG